MNLFTRRADPKRDDESLSDVEVVIDPELHGLQQHPEVGPKMSMNSLSPIGPGALI